jgi:hypothetical protein
VRFVPDHVTALYFTNAFQLLSERQRVRYTQLHGCYVNEQIMFFERALVPSALGDPERYHLPEHLRTAMKSFLEQEQRHAAMFEALNRRCAPELYADTDFYFIRPRMAWNTILRIMAREIQLFPVFLWLMLLQEERSIAWSRALLTAHDRLDGRFVDVYRLHLAEEVQHVRWDELMLDHFWPRTRPWLKPLNARLLGWFIREFQTVPKRAGVRIIRRLVREFADLEIHRRRMECELQQLARNTPYLDSLYGRDITPRTYARFDRTPDFAVREGIIHGYQPRAREPL